LERRRQHETRRAEILHLFRHLPDPQGALEATEQLVADHDRRVAASILAMTADRRQAMAGLNGHIEALQGTAERPEPYPRPHWRQMDPRLTQPATSPSYRLTPAYGAPSGSEGVLCRYRWPDEGDTLGRPHVCGLLVHHPGPHQAIGINTSYYDTQGTWHTGGATVLAEADQ
jgi:hypothetical protein